MPPQMPDASQFSPSLRLVTDALGWGAETKKIFWLFCDLKTWPQKWSQRSPNGDLRWPKFDQKSIKCRFQNLSWKMQGKMMKHLASGYWKTVVSRGRGCIFQGFHCLQKVGGTTPEIVSKWHQKCLKVGSEGSQKCRWNMQGQYRKLDEKRSPKWGLNKCVVVDVWYFFEVWVQRCPRVVPGSLPGSLQG